MGGASVKGTRTLGKALGCDVAEPDDDAWGLLKQYTTVEGKGVAVHGRWRDLGDGTAPRRARAITLVIGMRATVVTTCQATFMRLEIGLAAIRLRRGPRVTRPSTETHRLAAAVPAPPQFSAQDLTDLIRQI